VEDQGAEKPVFSPVRWQTWLQAEEMRLDNTGLYKTMEMLPAKGSEDLSTVYAIVVDRM
jgi:hypothetical protein